MRNLYLGVVLGLCLVCVLAAARAPAGDELTEVDKLRIENANLFDALATFVEEADNCRGQLAKPRAEANRGAATDRRAKLKEAIERAHPGFAFDGATGALTPTPLEKP